MNAPKVNEGNGFWKANKEVFISMIVIVIVMFCLKFLFNMAIQFHLT